MWFKKTPPPTPEPPADPHAECRTKRRVIVAYQNKQLWSAFVLEEYEGNALICNEDGSDHQWVTTSQIRELVPLKRDQEVLELQRIFKL